MGEGEGDLFKLSDAKKQQALTLSKRDKLIFSSWLHMNSPT